MFDAYILNDQFEPVPVADDFGVIEWKWKNTHLTITARTMLDPYEVSTVFLCIDHNWLREDDPDQRPVLWETMIFAKGDDPYDLDQWCQRYRSHAEAVEGHAKVVAMVLEKMMTRQIEEKEVPVELQRELMETFMPDPIRGQIGPRSPPPNGEEEPCEEDP